MSNAPIQQPIVTNTGIVPRQWALFFTDLSRLLLNKTPTPSLNTTVSTMPDPTLYTGNMIFVSNEAGGAVMAFSDGINWRRCTDRAIVS